MKNALPLSFALLLAAHSPLPAQTAVNPPPPIDVTFAFIADVHSSFNGSSDYEAIKSYSEYPALIFQEATGNNTCLYGTYVIDTCDMVQEARKLNALENNTWPSGTPTTGPIQLAGVAIGGDLTDCGAGADRIRGLSPTPGIGADCTSSTPASLSAPTTRPTPSAPMH